MADPLIEGIMNPEPKPGLVDSVKEYIFTPSTDEKELEEKRVFGNSCFTWNGQRLFRRANESR